MNTVSVVHLYLFPLPITFLLFFCHNIFPLNKTETYILDNAGIPHFLAAVNFCPAASLVIRCVVGNNPCLAFLTKYSCVLKTTKTVSNQLFSSLRVF